MFCIVDKSTAAIVGGGWLRSGRMYKTRKLLSFPHTAAVYVATAAPIDL